MHMAACGSYVAPRTTMTLGSLINTISTTKENPMNNSDATIEQLIQRNRQLKFGYLVVAVLGLALYTLSSPERTQAGPSDPDGNNIKVDINKVGDAQQMVAVDHESGFVVIIDEEGKVNVVYRDGTIIVPTRKFFPNQADVKPVD